jgi:hypothetical protein
MLPILIVPVVRRGRHPEYVEARRVDERDAKREAIELDDRARIIDDLDERRERWRQRCRLSRVIVMPHTLHPVRRSKFAVPASLEHCENLVNVLLARKQLTLPPSYPCGYPAVTSLHIPGDPACRRASRGCTSLLALGNQLAGNEYGAADEHTCVARSNAYREMVGELAGMAAFRFRRSPAASSIELRG